jgi:hypothetical protein
MRPGSETLHIIRPDYCAANRFILNFCDPARLIQMQHSFEELSRAICLWDQIERAKRFALLTTGANERARYASVADDYQRQLDHLLSAETVTADNPADAVSETRDKRAGREKDIGQLDTD